MYKKYRQNLKVSDKHLKCMCQVCVLHIEEASFDPEANGKHINRKGTLIKKEKAEKYVKRQDYRQHLVCSRGPLQFATCLNQHHE